MSEFVNGVESAAPSQSGTNRSSNGHGGRCITYEGGLGYRRSAQMELFLLAVSGMVGEDQFYETARGRLDRFAHLVRVVTAADPDWIRRFVPYLRNVLHLRTASLVAAAEYVAAGGSHGRQVVDSALMRADEPARLCAYWAGTRGTRFPQPLKRGIADAAVRLYDEYAVLKYDRSRSPWRMADVVALSHPHPVDDRQSVLFAHLTRTRRTDPVGPPDETLAILRAAWQLDRLPVDQRLEALLEDPARIAAAGFTWERVSGWLRAPMTASVWQALIPSMGYMALLRNLANFERARIGADVEAAVAARLADPAEVRRSKQMPMRFMSAAAAVGSRRWADCLESALETACENVPRLDGTTLVLVDVSGSMKAPLSKRSALTWSALAAMFGAVLATRGEHVDLYAYDHEVDAVTPQGTVLGTAAEIDSHGGGGTCTFQVLARTYRGHDRAVIITDEQAFWSLPSQRRIPCPVYTVNVGGYHPGHLPIHEQDQVTTGGLTDAAFWTIDQNERRLRAGWPF